MFPVEEKIPDFWDLAKKIASNLRAERFSDRETLLRQMSPLLEQSLIESMDKVIPGWRKIATLHEGQTALHTLLVFATCLNLPEYTLADVQTGMEIEWAALLHDLDKDHARTDTSHPFRSAAVVARILPELGFELLSGCDQADLEAWSTLVMSARRPDGESMIHDHAPLKEIMDGIHACWGRETSATRILKAVLLHQSLPTLQDWSNMVLLTDQELSYSITLQDMKVLGPLMVADSDSWNLFSELRIPYLYELRASNAETRRRIQTMGHKKESAS